MARRAGQSDMIRVTVVTHRRKCGKRGCRCVRERLHEATVLSYTGKASIDKGLNDRGGRTKWRATRQIRHMRSAAMSRPRGTAHLGVNDDLGRTEGAYGWYVARTMAAAAELCEPRGATVPTVVAHHDVTDKDHWLASGNREAFFGPLGVTNIRTFVNPQDPSKVALLMDVADMDVVMAAMQTPAAAQAMSEDGVVAETLVILVEE